MYFHQNYYDEKIYIIIIIIYIIIIIIIINYIYIYKIYIYIRIIINNYYKINVIIMHVPGYVGLQHHSQSHLAGLLHHIFIFY